MRHVDTIIVGGGPAGSTCAWSLTRRGQDVLVLDKAAFPRVKLCAGWITEKVLTDLAFTASDYPHPLTRLDIRSRFPKIPFALNWCPTRGDNFSIRRLEFDHWLLQRSGARVEQHSVKSIRRGDEGYVVDETYSCRHLVGAGGTMCPVRRAFFDEPRKKYRQVATLELEFEYPARQDECIVYFFHRGLLGYAWYVPKGDGFVNIGIGGLSKFFRTSGTSIHDHLREFLADLVREGRLDAATASAMKTTGHPYFLFAQAGEVKKDNCYLIGDSAGLASVDLGEGIGPAVESALMTAAEIAGEGAYAKDAISCYSIGGWTERVLKAAMRMRGFRL